MRYLLFLLLGCSANNPNTFDPQDVEIQDASVEMDATVPAKDAGYVACIKMTTTPTSYPRLQERSCVDSNGNSFTKDYWDTQLQLGCRWKPASDTIRCLPENENSSPFYADDTCQQMVAPMEVDSKFQLVEPYIGLDHYFDGGSYIDIYDQDGSFSGNLYHLEYWNEWVCNPLIFHFPGTQMYYLGGIVDPTIFVEK